MKKFLEDIAASINDRFKNPFLGTAFVAATAINYRTAVVLTSEESYRGKFWYLESELYPNWWMIALKLFTLPVLVAAFYTMLWPYIDTWISVRIQELQNRKIRRQIVAENRIPFPTDEQDKIFHRHEEELKVQMDRAQKSEERAAEQRQRSDQHLSSILERLHLVVLERWAVSAGVTREDVLKFIVPPPPNAFPHDTSGEVAKKLAATDEIALLISFFDKATQIPSARGRQPITDDWLQSALSLQGRQTQDFRELLSALKLIRESPGTTGEYERLVDLFTMQTIRAISANRKS